MPTKKFKDPKHPFKWKHFEGEIILWLIRWYCRYALTYSDLKEIAAERGLSVNRSTICRWVHEYGPEIKKRIKPYLKKASDSWCLDETYIKIKGKWKYLYRAIDKEGQTLDWMLSQYRNKKAAKRFFKKILSNSYIKMPRVINVDKNPAFLPVYSELQAENQLSSKTKLRQVKYLNNSVENDHKFIKCKSRYRQWYQSFITAKHTIDGIETLRIIQKGQVCHIARDNICAQNNFISQLFGLAA